MNCFYRFILGLGSFMLATPQGLPAQKDTTFVANGNPIVKYTTLLGPKERHGQAK